VVEGLRHIYRLAEITTKPTTLTGRPLPGCPKSDSELDRLKLLLCGKGASEPVANRLVRRYGARAEIFANENLDLAEVAFGICRGELDFHILLEQAATVDDLMLRRLEANYLPDHGIALLAAVQKALAKVCDANNLKSQLDNYSIRMNGLDTILRTATARMPAEAV
jgi:glycerol-3-phosphate dehydrogenase